MIELSVQKDYEHPEILVLGIGGAGNNAVNRMVETGDYEVTYVAVNTDKMVLGRSRSMQTLAIGEKLTGGYGAGGDPEVGEAAAAESTEALKSLLTEAKMVILTGGMGGGTGTGAIPVIAALCRELKILSVAVVTKPFTFEGKRRTEVAAAGIEKLKSSVDTLLVIPNDRVLEMKSEASDIETAFAAVDSVLSDTISAITNIIFNCGRVNLDFNDLKTVLADKGEGHLGIATGTPDSDISGIINTALHSPLLETDIRGAAYVLINVSGKFSMKELDAAIQQVRSECGEDTYIMWGTVAPDDAGDEIVVTIIATGLKEVMSKTPRVFIEPTYSRQEEAHKSDLIGNFQPKLNIPVESGIKIPGFLQGYTGENK